MRKLFLTGVASLGLVAHSMANPNHGTGDSVQQGSSHVANGSHPATSHPSSGVHPGNSHPSVQVGPTSPQAAHVVKPTTGTNSIHVPTVHVTEPYKTVSKPVPVAAGGSKPSPVNKPSGIVVSKPGSAYHQKFGTPFAGGFCYYGKHHCHWTYFSYSYVYRCTVYWCPSTCVYYYWCGTCNCYYPVSYFSSAPVTEVAPTIEPAPRPEGVPPLPE